MGKPSRYMGWIEFIVEDGALEGTLIDIEESRTARDCNRGLRCRGHAVLGDEMLLDSTDFSGWRMN